MILRPARRTASALTLLFACGLCTAAHAKQTQTKQPTAAQVLADVINRWADVIEPPAGEAARALRAKVTVTKADGLPHHLAGTTLELAFQSPDHLRATARFRGETYAAGRDGQKLWFHEPGSKLAILGSPDVPRFKRFPNEREDPSPVPPFALPVSRFKLAMMALTVTPTLEPETEINGVRCDVLTIVPKAATAALLGSSGAQATMWLRQIDRLPVRIAFTDGAGVDVQLDLADVSLSGSLPAETWTLRPAPDDKVEHVASAHLVRFLQVLPKLGHNAAPTLGPATGERRVVATEGAGRLEEIDGTRVLSLKGSPEEMGHQHGVLLKPEIHDVCDRILYGIGVGSSIPKGRWFFGEIEDAQARLEPFIDKRHLAEMDALANAAGVHVQEARLANFFPELFHCSGFAMFGRATKDGRMYHGRVLDYLRGVGLEQNAVVIVHQSNYGHAWVNLGYAGFAGTVTAMNERGISIGEMGGGGEGEWDGKPMAELMREVMERASTLDEAVEILRKGPRTCQYYYVIADGPRMTAVGIAASPNSFEVVHPGESHPRLPHPMPDTVLLSAGDRYETLTSRVQKGYGTFDADSAMQLMTRPVCMTSNIQSVLFAPDTLDFWVANADAKNVASATRFTHYNLKALLRSDEGPSANAGAR
jgi:outer membrane lipoprotein-sorting protein